MTAILTFFAALPGKLRLWAGLTGAAAVAIFVAYLRGRQQGARSVKEEIAHRTQKVKDKWNEIDHRPDSLDDALGKLRDR